MSYDIQYSGEIEKIFNKHKEMNMGCRAVMFICVAVIIVAVWVITPVRTAVLDFLLPGNGAVTRRAASVLFHEMKNGLPFREAFSNFCIEILENS